MGTWEWAPFGIQEQKVNPAYPWRAEVLRRILVVRSFFWWTSSLTLHKEMLPLFIYFFYPYVHLLLLFSRLNIWPSIKTMTVCISHFINISGESLYTEVTINHLCSTQWISCTLQHFIDVTEPLLTHYEYWQTCTSLLFLSIILFTSFIIKQYFTLLNG